MRAGWVCGLLVFALGGIVARGADPFSEDFSTNDGGWRAVGMSGLSWTNQGLKGSFAAQGVPAPETGTFAAPTSAVPGHYVGDYPAARLGLVGFSFYAKQVKPSSMLLRLRNDSLVFFRDLDPSLIATGRWQHFAISLQTAGAGGWNGGTEAQFRQLVSNVARLELSVARSGTGAQEYLLDDFFVLPLHEAVAMDRVSEQLLDMQFSDLRSNVPYRVEAADELTGIWTQVGAWAPAGSTFTWTGTNADGVGRAYRLVTDEVR